MSNKKTTYTQCTLKNKEWIQVAWIPTKYAVKDRQIKIRENDVWKEWRVTVVGQTIDRPIYSPELIKIHRNNTGDSMPRMKKQK